MMYKLNKFLGQEVGITRLSDGASIPFDESNTDFQEYKRWLDAGNTPLPADEVTV